MRVTEKLVDNRRNIDGLIDVGQAEIALNFGVILDELGRAVSADDNEIGSGGIDVFQDGANNALVDVAR